MLNKTLITNKDIKKTPGKPESSLVPPEKINDLYKSSSIKQPDDIKRNYSSYNTPFEEFQEWPNEEILTNFNNNYNKAKVVKEDNISINRIKDTNFNAKSNEVITSPKSYLHYQSDECFVDPCDIVLPESILKANQDIKWKRIGDFIIDLEIVSNIKSLVSYNDSSNNTYILSLLNKIRDIYFLYVGKQNSIVKTRLSFKDNQSYNTSNNKDNISSLNDNKRIINNKIEELGEFKAYFRQMINLIEEKRYFNICEFEFSELSNSNNLSCNNVENNTNNPVNIINEKKILINNMYINNLDSNIYPIINWIASIYQFIIDNNLSQEENLIKRIYPQVNGIPVYNSYGKYWVKLFYQGKDILVEVDDYVPVNQDEKIMMPCCFNLYNEKSKLHSINTGSSLSEKLKNNIWPFILSKALYKLFSFKYVNLEYIDSEVGDLCYLTALTSFCKPQKIKLYSFDLINEILNNSKYEGLDNKSIDNTLILLYNKELSFSKENFEIVSILRKRILERFTSNRTLEKSINYKLKTIRSPSVIASNISNKLLPNIDGLEDTSIKLHRKNYKLTDINNQENKRLARDLQKNTYSSNKANIVDVVSQNTSDCNTIKDSLIEEHQNVLFTKINNNELTLNNTIYSLYDCFDNYKFNMMRLKLLDFSDIKKKMNDNKLPYKQLNKKEKLEYLDSLASLRREQKEIIFKRIERLKDDGINYKLIKINNSSDKKISSLILNNKCLNNKKLSNEINNNLTYQSTSNNIYNKNSKSNLNICFYSQLISEFTDKDIEIAKVCLKNNWKYPPIEYYKEMFFADESNINHLISIFNKENNINNTTNKESKAVTNRSTNVNNITTHKKINSISNEYLNVSQDLLNSKKADKLWNKDIYLKIMEDNIVNFSNIETNLSLFDYLTNLQRNNGIWLKFAESCFNSAVLIHNSKKYTYYYLWKFKWENYKNDYFNDNVKNNVISLKPTINSIKDEDSNIYNNKSKMLIIFNYNTIKEGCSLDFNLNLKISNNKDSNEINVKFTKDENTYYTDNLSPLNNYYIQIDSGLYPYGFSLELYSIHHDFENISYENFTKINTKIESQIFNLAFPSLQENKHYLISKYTLSNVKCNLNIMFDFNLEDIYISKSIYVNLYNNSNKNNKRIYPSNYFLIEPLNNEEDYYIIDVAIYSPSNIDSYSFQLNFYIDKSNDTNNNIAIKEINLVEPYYIQDEVKKNKYGLLFKTYVYPPDISYCNLFINLVKEEQKMSESSNIARKTMEKISNKLKNTQISTTNNATTKVYVNIDTIVDLSLEIKDYKGDIVFEMHFYNKILTPNIMFEGFIKSNNNNYIKPISNEESGIANINKRNSKNNISNIYYEPYELLCYVNLNTSIEWWNNINENSGVLWQIFIYPSETIGICINNNKELLEKKLIYSWENDQKGRAIKANKSRQYYLISRLNEKGVEIDEDNKNFLTEVENSRKFINKELNSNNANIKSIINKQHTSKYINNFFNKSNLFKNSSDKLQDVYNKLNKSQSCSNYTSINNKKSIERSITNIIESIKTYEDIRKYRLEEDIKEIEDSKKHLNINIKNSLNYRNIINNIDKKTKDLRSNYNLKVINKLNIDNKINTFLIKYELCDIDNKEKTFTLDNKINNMKKEINKYNNFLEELNNLYLESNNNTNNNIFITKLKTIMSKIKHLDIINILNEINNNKENYLVNEEYKKNINNRITVLLKEIKDRKLDIKDNLHKKLTLIV